MHLMSNVFDALDVEQIASTSAPKFADVVHFKSIRDNISTSSVLFWRQLFFTSKPISGIERICRRLVIVNLARWGSSLIKGAEEPVSNSLRSILRLFDVLFRICLFVPLVALRLYLCLYYVFHLVAQSWMFGFPFIIQFLC